MRFIKKITMILLSLLVILFVTLLTTYFVQKTKKRSEDLKKENLKGFVKNITSNEILSFDTPNVLLYDFEGNLLLKSQSSFSTGLSWNSSNQKSIQLENYFVCRNETDELTEKNYKELFSSKRTYVFANNKFDVTDIQGWQNYSISEQDFLMIQLTKNDKVFKSYIVDKDFNISQLDCFEYHNDTIKVTDCQSSGAKIIKLEKGEYIESILSIPDDDFYNKAITSFHNGLPVKLRVFDKDGNCWKIENKKYDDHGNVIELTVYEDRSKSEFGSPNPFTDNSNKNFIQKIKYSYDSNGNWIRKRKISVADGSSKTISRKIEYYGFFDFFKNIL